MQQHPQPATSSANVSISKLRHYATGPIYRLANPVPAANLNNRVTDICPVPPPRQQSEWPLHKALLILLPRDKVYAAMNKEMKKIFVIRSTLEPNAVYVPTKLIIREKLNGDITARMPLGGDRQPPHTYNDTHASFN